MKTKLFLLFLLLSLIVKAQINTFVENDVEDPDQIVFHNNYIYFTDEVSFPVGSYIKRINTTDANPMATIFYGPLPDDKSFIDLVINGDTLITTYVDVNNKSTIASIDLTLSTPVMINHINNLGFIKCLAIKDNNLFHTEVSVGTFLAKRNLSDLSLEGEFIVSLVNGTTRDMHFKDNILYITNNGIRSVDVSATTPTLTLVKSGFLEAIHIVDDYIFYSDTGAIKKFPISNPDNVITLVTTGEVYARDLVNIGQTLYITDKEFDRIATIVDATLDVNTILSKNNDINVYPNPTQDFLYFSENIVEVTVFDLTGRLIKSFSGNQVKIDISTLSNGNYILKGETELGEQFNVKFIKN